MNVKVKTSSPEELDELLDKMTPEQMALLKQRIDETEKKQEEFEAAETVEDVTDESVCEDAAEKAAEEESAENYLETILVLKNRNGAVRSIDIANELGFSKPSVSVAMKNLRENGYIEVDPSGYITLLDSGRQIAEKIYERHTTISKWLMSIGVDEKNAVEDACRIEHIISSESFEAIKRISKPK